MGMSESRPSQPVTFRPPGRLQKAFGRVNGRLRWNANRVFQRRLGEARPVFFDVDETCPQLRKLHENFEVIREEMHALLPRWRDIPRYHEVDPTQKEIARGEKDWRFLVLHMYRGGSLVPNREKCPRTIAILDQIPGLVGGYFSVLEGGKSIPAHRGPYLGYLRYHLALEVPERDPPSIRIRDQFYTWRQGEGVLFDDSLEHEVFNESDGIRVVLIADVLRPMPWHLALLNRFVVRFGAAKILRRNIWEAMKVLDAGS
jgi:aspartate beta-hydroxylase/beta-hydroxylase